MQPLILELNIALAPSRILASRLTQWSQEIAKHTTDTRVMLGEGGVRLSDVPHLTLYQVPICTRDLDTLHQQLQAIIQTESPYELTATELTYNDGERSLEVGYQTSEQLAGLQMKVIDIANNLRGDLLLEKDPAGNLVSDLLEEPGELGQNIRQFGYGEIGGLFRPHATLNWFGPTTDFALAEQKSPKDMAVDGVFDTLIISALGSHGRCAQQLAYFPLAS